METIILIVLFAIAAETTYLTVGTLRKERRETLAPVFVDTSVLIDGRIISVAESGFLTRPLYIPRSVVGELQFLADNADAEKRSRARHGLDVINTLQSIDTIKTVIFADGVRADEGVDNRLLSLAKKHGGALCTIDYNLNKVALVEGIQVLNPNELAKTLRMAYLPGERTHIELTQKGNDQHQAVGHLEDGTMVVVEHAYKQIGKSVEVEFIRSLQTAAGKMMFARLAHPAQEAKKQVKSQPKNQAGTKRETTIATKRPVRRVSTSASKATPAPVTKATSTSSKSGATSRPAPRRRPKSPEDSMVELANK